MNGRGGSALGAIVGALLLAVGVALAGWFVGQGIVAPRKGDRFVTVKGLAEKDVKADLALWPMRFVATGNDLAEVRATITANEAAVRKFLTDGGVPAEAISVNALEVNDLFAQIYRSGPVENRYIVAETLLVRSTDVDRIAGLAQKVGDLVAAGVVLSSESQPVRPVFLFTKLNDVKPPMVAEATANARAAAVEFAKDSGAELGGIRQASQGLFQILPRDEAPGINEPNEIDKRLRVVSTIDYYLNR